MKYTFLFVLLSFLVTDLSAHGGQYRGPGDVVPPGPGGGGNTGRPSGPTTGGPAGPTTGGPAGPATGGPAGPSTGGPTGPGGRPRGPVTGGRGASLGADLTQWAFWWEFNKDPFIRLKDEINKKGPQTGSDDFYLGSTRKSHNSLALSRKDKLNVLATLRRAMKSTNNRDIITACMIAMAKVGVDHPEFKLKDVFTPYLQSNNQEVRETAALALGIAAQTESDELDILIKLALGKEVK
jgi:hypothetical protein